MYEGFEIWIFSREESLALIKVKVFYMNNQK